jgi:hypothetical protein
MYIGGPSRWDKQERGKRKERILRGKEDGSNCIYTYDNSVTKPTIHCLKEEGRRRDKWYYNGDSELVQGTLYTSNGITIKSP